MITIPFNIKLWLILGLVCIQTTGLIGQGKAIDLEESLSIARENYPGLERDRLSVEQQNKLANAGLPFQSTQLYFSGEEFGFNDPSGIHSINIQQNFYLPKVNKVQRAYYKHNAKVAEKRLILTDRELKRQVERAYYQLQYAKQEQTLALENLDLFTDFLTMATAQLENGETGKIPQLAARSRLSQAQLEIEHAVEKFQIALTMFNQWLHSDSLYNVSGELLLNSNYASDSIFQNNPHLQLIQAQRELANAKVETEKVKLLPQINSGFKLQTASGSFPLFGYQIGVNIPLFKKAYRGRIEAAKIGVLVQEAALKTEQQQLTQIISELHYRLEHQLHVLDFLQQNLTPIVNEQSEVNLKAYQEGEIIYLEYLDSLEQVVKVKQQYLKALYNFHVLKVELGYWRGN